MYIFNDFIIVVFISISLKDNKQLQKEVSNKKQEAQALMAEMESITQAFEEVQEQNLRLLEQLKVHGEEGFVPLFLWQHYP